MCPCRGQAHEVQPVDYLRHLRTFPRFFRIHSCAQRRSNTGSTQFKRSVYEGARIPSPFSTTPMSEKKQLFQIPKDNEHSTPLWSITSGYTYEIEYLEKQPNLYD
jgi:hypothetical protein